MKEYKSIEERYKEMYPWYKRLFNKVSWFFERIWDNYGYPAWKHWYQRAKRGYSDRDLWRQGIPDYMLMTIYPMLKRLKKESYILNQMKDSKKAMKKGIKGFELLKKLNDYEFDMSFEEQTKPEFRKKMYKESEENLIYFIKNFHQIWE